MQNSYVYLRHEDLRFVVFRFFGAVRFRVPDLFAGMNTHSAYLLYYLLLNTTKRREQRRGFRKKDEFRNFRELAGPHPALYYPESLPLSYKLTPAP